MRFLILPLVVVLLAQSYVIAQETLSHSDSPRTVAELVSRLASPNKPVGAGPFASYPKKSYPKSYDHEAQKVVEEARAQLLKHGFNAIPELIKHISDARYCRTVPITRLVDKTVGDECYDLIEAITSPSTHPDFNALPPSQFKWVKGNAMRLGADNEWDYVSLSYLTLLIARDESMTRESIAKWWEGFADKSIEHIHLAAVRRLIAHEESIGFHSDANKERYLKPYRDLENQLATGLKQRADK